MYSFSFQVDRLSRYRREGRIISMVRSVHWSVSRFPINSRISNRCARSAHLMEPSGVMTCWWCQSFSIVDWYIAYVRVRSLRLVVRPRSLSRGYEGVKRSRQTYYGQRQEREKKRNLQRLRVIVVELVAALTLEPSGRSYVRKTNRQKRRRSCWLAASTAKRCERNVTLYPFYSEFAKNVESFFPIGKRSFILPVKMKSSATCYTRRLRGATFDEDEQNIVATSFWEVNSTTCHYHYPSSNCGAFEKDDGISFLPSPASTTACDLCERLRGQTGYESVNAIWTGDNHVADRSRRKRDKNDLLTNDSKTTVGKRDRTLRCDRTPLHESSAKCASSVVRWIFSIRFYRDFKSTEWRRLLWIVLLILTVPDLAAAHDTGLDNGGEYILFFLYLLKWRTLRPVFVVCYYITVLMVVNTTLWLVRNFLRLYLRQS